MGTIKDRNGKDLREAEEIKKKNIQKNDTQMQEYTEKWYTKYLNDLDNHDDMVTHLEPDILKCEVMWALGGIIWTKLVEVMEFQLSYFKS